MSMRQIYRKIAKKHGVSVAEVKKDMQEAIDIAYKSAPNDGITAAYQDRVVRKGNIPTPDEFIRYAAAEIKKNKS